MRQRFAALALLLAVVTMPTPANAQPPRQVHAGELAAALQRLGVVGSVLYIAAHPDDENTKLLAWLVGDRGLRAGYLSLTRGDGGQNLIGTEQDELLGLIRTHELLAARAIDGAEQLFTRVRDLGFTKSADETLRIWGHDAALADIVLMIRRFRPDVVISRFNLKLPNHGHHTASALLTDEAFTAAADPQRFPEQLSQVQPWRADRLLYNVSTWNLPKDADLSLYLHLDVGGFDALRGKSWGEVAAESRSQHKSQGFGVAAGRGPAIEHFQALQGTRPKADVFEGLDFTWQRYPGGDAVARAVEAAQQGLDVRQPHKSIPALLQVYAALAKLPDANPWKAIKLQETQALLAQCAGLFLEVRAVDPSATPGSELAVTVVALNRTPAQARLVGLQLPGSATETLDKALVHHAPVTLERRVKVADAAPISTPYWLRKATGPDWQREGGLYDVPDQRLIGRPEGDAPLAATFTYELGGKRFSVVRPLVYAWVDPVRGERYRDVEIVPDVTATLDRDVVMVVNGKPQTVTIQLVAGRDAVAGTLQLDLPAGWQATPAQTAFKFDKRGDEQTVRLQVAPPKNASERAQFHVVTTVGGQRSSWRLRTVAHEHVPPLAVRQASSGTLVPLTLEIPGKRLGYIPGPGDRVAESLSAVGYEVTLLPEDRLVSENLAKFDAILVGIRAFNAHPRLAAHRQRLLQYVSNGGRLVVQYQTQSRIAALTVPIGPYPLEIGRDRVTDETAAMTPIDAKEPLLQRPNRLGPEDFSGWVQERGLYFASKWDDRYRAVFALQDPGEAAHNGALILTKYGKGTFAYTGLAFFRQLPAGVPGAYRLLANLLAL